MSRMKSKQAGSLSISHGWIWLFILGALLFAFLFNQEFSNTQVAQTTSSQLTLLNPVADSQEPTDTELVLENEEDRRELVTKIAFNEPIISTPNSQMVTNLKSVEVELEKGLDQGLDKGLVNDEDKEYSAALSAAVAEEKQIKNTELVAEPVLEDLERNAAVPDILEVDPQEFRSLMKVDINYLIEQWRQAWQSGDSETYLSFYSSQFMPSGDKSYSSWLQQRKRMVVPSKQITLVLSNFDVVLDDNNQQSIVSFDQEYTSSTHTDKSRKQLTLIKETHWRIIAEAIID